jgi:septum formation protein
LGETPLVLASASPRRAALLRDLGVPFTLRPADVEETVGEGEPPARAAVRLAEAKARAAAGPGNALVLGADTLVVLEGRPLGKPRDPAHARAMLLSLSGRDHEVVTGVALLRERDGGLVSGVERSRVHFRELTEEDLRALVESGEAMDKAGAYGIQGLASLVVTRLDGDYTNVVGLPLGLLRRLIRAAQET